MWRRALRVSRRAHETKHAARRYQVSDFQSGRVRVEVCIVINAPTRTDDRNCLATQIVLANLVNVAGSGGEYRSSFWRKDVLTFMQSASSTWRVPRVCDLFFRHVFERHGNLAIRLLRVESGHAAVKDERVGDCSAEAGKGQQQQSNNENA